MMVSTSKHNVNHLSSELQHAREKKKKEGEEGQVSS